MAMPIVARTYASEGGQLMKIPAKYSNLLFGGFLSGIQVVIISGAVVLLTRGFDAEFPQRWLRGIAIAWPVSFPSAVVLTPWVRKIVSRLTAVD
jgi:hypothetical protein